MKFDDIFSVDKRREEGAWITDGYRDLPDLKIKVRGEGCSAQIARIREIVDAASAEERKADDFEENLNKQVMLDVMLLDWRIDDRPYDRESAKAAIETATFREAVAYATRAVASRGALTLEADTKN